MPDSVNRIFGAASARKRPKPDAAEGLRSLLEEAFPICRLCTGKMEGHEAAGIARWPLSRATQIQFEEMMAAVKRREWEQLKAFQRWEPLLPDAEVYLLRCPDGRYNLTVVYCPFELGDNYYALFQEEINESDLPEMSGGWRMV